MSSLLLLGTSALGNPYGRGGGGHYGGGGGHGGRVNGPHQGGGGHVNGPHQGGGGFHGNGHVGSPTRFNPGRAPYGGWRGNRYFYGGHPYFVWGWGPWAPWWGWGPYYGWHVGLGYYVPEGLRCYADNPQVPRHADWVGQDVYYASDDAINSALGYCETDPEVEQMGVQSECRIRTCVRW